MKNYQSIYTEEIRTPEHESTTISHNAHPQDHLAPPFDSDERPSNLFVGTFNLIATIVGGGVLSLPMVFEKCGVALTTVGMIFSAHMAYMSLVMLCYCSRRGGGFRYGEVVRSAFGERMEEAVSWLLFLLLMFLIIGYMILIRDIWTPLVQQTLRIQIDGDYVLLGITVLLLPALFQRSLHSVRWNCYVGSASIFVLCIALCHGGWKNLKNQPLSINDSDDADDTIEDDNNDSFTIYFLKMPSVQDILFSFPILALIFLCQFNIISIQNELSKPSRQRIQNLSQYAISASFLLMYSFGLGGYLYAGTSTKGNILLNVPMARQQSDDGGEYYLFLLGRIGCGTTVVLAMPILLLPCREALLKILDSLLCCPNHPSESTQCQEDQSCKKSFHQYNLFESIDNDKTRTKDEQFGNLSIAESQAEDLNGCGPLSKSPILIRRGPIQSTIFRNALPHYGSTLCIITMCYVIAVAVTGVAAVFSFIGSSMALFIAFILPCGCFIVIETPLQTVDQGGDRKDEWIRLAKVILLFSVVGAVVCTVNNTLGLWHNISSRFDDIHW